MASVAKKLRVGVVGVGYLGRYHVEKYAGMAEVDLAGVADVSLPQARAIADKFAVRAYPSHRDLIGKVDAVSVVVPTREHFSVAKDFLENGVDVMIEKPITTTLAEADELLRLSESRDLIIQVGHLERFNPAAAPLRDVVTNPRLIESRRLSVFNVRGTDVSVVLDLMIHDIDMVLCLVRSEIKNIQAAGMAVVTDLVDVASARLEFENGCVADLTASRVSEKNERITRLFQREGYPSITVDFANREIALIRRNPDTPNGLSPVMDMQRREFKNGDALADELKSFVKAVSRREVPEVTGRMGRDALKVALDIMDRIQTTGKNSGS